MVILMLLGAFEVSCFCGQVRRACCAQQLAIATAGAVLVLWPHAAGWQLNYATVFAVP
jgi:hypothetical protein